MMWGSITGMKPYRRCRAPILIQLWPTAATTHGRTHDLQVLTLSPEVRSLLEELQKKYNLLLITNGDTQTQWENRSGEMWGLFSLVVVGGDHPEQKPACSIFTHCFESAGVRPQDCIMVGDSLSTDIQGGINAGVRATVWINSDCKSLPQGSVTPDYTVPSVLNLNDVLLELSWCLHKDFFF